MTGARAAGALAASSRATGGSDQATPGTTRTASAARTARAFMGAYGSTAGTMSRRMPCDVHRPRSCRALLAGAGLAVATWLHAPHAVADGKADARALYDQGAAAFDAGDYPRAASLLADADAMAPNATVLKLALGA